MRSILVLVLVVVVVVLRKIVYRVICLPMSQSSGWPSLVAVQIALWYEVGVLVFWSSGVLVFFMESDAATLAAKRVSDRLHFGPAPNTNASARQRGDCLIAICPARHRPGLLQESTEDEYRRHFPQISHRLLSAGKILYLHPDMRRRLLHPNMVHLLLSKEYTSAASLVTKLVMVAGRTNIL